MTLTGTECLIADLGTCANIIALAVFFSNQFGDNIITIIFISAMAVVAFFFFYPAHRYTAKDLQGGIVYFGGIERGQTYRGPFCSQNPYNMSQRVIRHP